MEETLALGLSKKMIRGMGNGWEQSLNRIEEKLSVKKTDLPRHIILSGKGLPPEITHYIGLIHSAILNYQRVKLIYTPLYSDKKTHRRVDPYYLFFEEDFWYFRGYCHLREEPRTFALDRIISIKLLEEHFLPRNISPEEELSGAFGAYMDGEPIEVVLRFDEDIKPYIRRKIWHQSQNLLELDDSRLELHFKVNGLDGIVQWVYRWLPYVEVVSPKELREIVCKELKMALKKNKK